MTDFRIGFVRLLPPDGDGPPEEVDPDFLQGQIDAFLWLPDGLMRGIYGNPQVRQRHARNIEEALWNPQLVADLESTIGPEFICGYRQIFPEGPSGFLARRRGRPSVLGQAHGSSSRSLIFS